MLRFDHVDAQVLQRIERVATEHALQHLLCIFLAFHVLKVPLSVLGWWSGGDVLSLVVVILVVATLIHVHRQLHQGVIRRTAVFAAETAGSRKDCAARFGTLPVQVDGAE